MCQADVKTLRKPKSKSYDACRLGRQCMARDPKERPTFEDISRALKHIASKLARTNSNDLSNFRSLSCP